MTFLGLENTIDKAFDLRHHEHNIIYVIVFDNLQYLCYYMMLIHEIHVFELQIETNNLFFSECGFESCLGLFPNYLQ